MNWLKLSLDLSVLLSIVLLQPCKPVDAKLSGVGVTLDRSGTREYWKKQLLIPISNGYSRKYWKLQLILKPVSAKTSRFGFPSISEWKDWLRAKKRALAFRIWKSDSKHEKHFPGYNYCGPGTKLAERLARGDKPINPLDAACKLHDLAYAAANNMDDIEAADRRLLDAAIKRKKELHLNFSYEKFFAEGVILAMKSKIIVGVF